MSIPYWTPRVFSDGAQKTMINKTSAQIIKLAEQGSFLALHVLVSTPSRQRTEFLPSYCFFLHHSEPPDPGLLAAQDGGACDAVDRACYCMMGVSEVLDAMEKLPRDPDTARKLTPLIAAWTDIFRWMVYVYNLYGTKTTLHQMGDICTATIACALGWEEMRNQVIQTPGIVALTAVWMDGELTPDLPSPVAAWCLGDILNGLPLSAARQVGAAAASSDIADRLIRGLRIASRTLPSELPPHSRVPAAAGNTGSHEARGAGGAVRRGDHPHGDEGACARVRARRAPRDLGPHDPARRAVPGHQLHRCRNQHRRCSTLHTRGHPCGVP
ncbi:hypothetical protein FA95DRAFT_561168 [Auriscalpium vulgare]|uniref:Uncharacterized protein n=1 Tax=Auriscalpium vulgare TaxID=40419 RepID=A0ACB8RFR4_9AGAM|nr:hypothetical protein FA95DRAFT_561168 [Auriscalpium vulgare]